MLDSTGYRVRLSGIGLENRIQLSKSNPHSTWPRLKTEFGNEEDKLVEAV